LSIADEADMTSQSVLSKRSILSDHYHNGQTEGSCNIHKESSDGLDMTKFFMMKVLKGNES